MVRAQAPETLPAPPPGTGASAVWTTIRNSSGRSTATVSPAGRPVAGSSNRTVTLAAGCPADKRRLLATDGGGGCISTCRAAGLPTAPMAARSLPGGALTPASPPASPPDALPPDEVPPDEVPPDV